MRPFFKMEDSFCFHFLLTHTSHIFKYGKMQNFHLNGNSKMKNVDLNMSNIVYLWLTGLEIIFYFQLCS